MISKQLSLYALSAVLVLCLPGLQTAEAGPQVITFVGEAVDQTDFAALGFGQTGYYFPQFGAGSPVTERPTDENMRFSVPTWLGFQFDIAQADRTFSPDAGCFSGNVPLCNTGPDDPIVFGVYSEGGNNDWDSWTLPALAGGEVGFSGSVVDEATQNANGGNSNNTVNRIQLGLGVPSSFLLRVVVDNTNFEHNPAGRLRARGDSNNGGVDVDVDLANLTFNGTTDIYTFRYDKFEPGDFIKIQLNSGAAGVFAGFGGLMFDVPLDADFDSDGDVDGADFLAWQRGFGIAGSAAHAQGDANFDRDVNVSDLNIWQDQFGQATAMEGATVSVPEPTTLVSVLMISGCLLVMSRYSRYEIKGST